MERTNTKKEYNQHSSEFIQSSLADLRKITFILFESHRCIDKTIDFYFFLLLWKSSVMNPKSWPVKLNSEEYKLLYKYISCKNL